MIIYKGKVINGTAQVPLAEKLKYKEHLNKLETEISILRALLNETIETTTTKEEVNQIVDSALERDNQMKQDIRTLQTEYEDLIERQKNKEKQENTVVVLPTGQRETFSHEQINREEYIFRRSPQDNKKKEEYFKPVLNTTAQTTKTTVVKVDSIKIIKPKRKWVPWKT